MTRLFVLLFGSHLQLLLCVFKPDKNWEVDLEHLESRVDGLTRALVVLNPSNPCGSVYSREHLKDILAVAQRNRIPVIADEIYDKLVRRNGNDQMNKSVGMAK